MRRRTFLKNTLQATAALAAINKARSQTPAGIRLGFDTYSLRAWNWKATEFIDYASNLKLDSIQLSSLEDFESLDLVYLQKVKDHAASAGIVLDGGIGCICDSTKSWNAKQGTPVAYLLKGIEVAKAIGSTSLRCFMGSSEDRLGPVPVESHIANTVKTLKAVRSQAMDAGVKIAVENHSGDMQARELKVLIQEAGKDYTAACLDTGNPMWVAEDPFTTLEVLGPYTVTTHIRDSILFEHPRGAAAQWVALGEGTIDFRRFVARFREVCPNSTMQLENITGRPPRVIPYLEPDFWKTFPKASAAEFARFVALAKSGHPLMTTMVVEDAGKQPPEYAAALREQQRVDLERGFAYAKKILGVGMRWKV